MKVCMKHMERMQLQELDELVMNASPEELAKIQEIDCKTQMRGMPFYDAYMDSKALVSQNAEDRRKPTG